MHDQTATERPADVSTTGGVSSEGVGRILALGLLIIVDVTMKLGRFKGVHRLVARWPTRQRRKLPEPDAHSLNDLFDRATMYYIKRPTCLHRSAALVVLMRIYGIPARLVVGARRVPFDAHAWVEVDDRPIGEKKPIVYYNVLERC
jgi:hypothetical protein